MQPDNEVFDIVAWDSVLMMTRTWRANRRFGAFTGDSYRVAFLNSGLMVGEVSSSYFLDSYVVIKYISEMTVLVLFDIRREVLFTTVDVNLSVELLSHI
jgi:hypothetical protein